MELYINRDPTPNTLRTPGELFVEHIFYAYTCEDPVREIPGKPVADWKIPGQTAIPRGRYRITLETSPKFGPETITINNVSGYVGIRMHGGLDETHTEGCPLAAYARNDDGTLVSGTSKIAIANLKRVIKEALSRRNFTEEVWITVK